jgi:hypothetical protein
MPETTENFTGTVVVFTVPTTGTYDITADGASGASSKTGGGGGAEITGEFQLTAGEQLTIVVGGAGYSGSKSGGGGGGGSFVIETYNGTGSVHTPLVIAGGGGGGGYYTNNPPSGGYSGTSGGTGAGDAGGAGGTNGGVGAGGGADGGGGGGYRGGSGGVGSTYATNGRPQNGHYGGGSAGGNGGAGGFGGGGGGGYNGGGGGGGFSGGGGGSGTGGVGAFGTGGGGGGGSYNSGTNQVALADTHFGNGVVTIDPVCYLRGTRILTSSGEIPVERLKVGDLVTTVSGAQRPLRWIGFGRTLVTAHNQDRARPIVVRRHALRDFVPHRDLYVTRGHSLYLDGVLIPVEALINHRLIAWDETARVVEYYHLELDSHDVVLAEGAAAETYRDDGNSPQFLNAGTRPDTLPMAPYAPVLHDHPQVKHIWRRLNARAGRVDLVLTDDPDLHLRVDGVRLDADQIEPRIWRFRLPGPVADLRIVSRSAIPSMLGIEQDQRRLGVALRRIVLAQPGLRREVGWEDVGLATGFHGPEPAEQHRWTSGEAVMPQELLADLCAGALVELHVNCLLRYPMPEAAGPEVAIPDAAMLHRGRAAA